jgi:hypothetical protein
MSRRYARSTDMVLELHRVRRCGAPGWITVDILGYCDTYWDQCTTISLSVLASIVTEMRFLTFVFLLRQRSQLLCTRCAFGAPLAAFDTARGAPDGSAIMDQQQPRSAIKT